LGSVGSGYYNTTYNWKKSWIANVKSSTCWNLESYSGGWSCPIITSENIGSGVWTTSNSALVNRCPLTGYCWDLEEYNGDFEMS